MVYEALKVHCRHRGMVYALVSGVVWGFNGLGTTLTVQRVSPCILGYIFFLCHVIGLPFIDWSLDQIYTPRITLIMLFSSFLYVILVVTAVFSYSFINFGNASALLYSKTIFCGVLAWILLGERFSKFDIVLLGIYFVGVILVTKPSFIFKTFIQVDQLSNLIGCALALSGSLASSLEYITVRYLAEREAFDVALLFVIKSFIGMLLTGILSYFTVSSHRYIRALPELGYVIFTCISGLVACALNIVALRTENAKTVAAIVSIEVIVAFLLQVSFTDQPTDILSVSGAALIIVVLVAFCVEGIHYQNRMDVQ